LLVGRTSFEPHVVLSMAVLLVAPLWRTVAIPFLASFTLPPTPLLFCALAKRTLQPTPIVGVKVVEGALGTRPEITTATIHRRRGGFADETWGREVGSRFAPPPRHVRQRSRRGGNGV
jgi:hypothetical protein